MKNDWFTAADRSIPAFLSYIAGCSNGQMDIDAFLRTPAADLLLERLLRRGCLQQDPHAAESYYASLGVHRKLFQPEDYWGRWALFSPAVPDDQRRYPLVIWNHGAGNAMEAEEYCIGFPEMAGNCGFFCLMAQNTNADHILGLMDELCAHLPIDDRQVFIAGFSHGGLQASGTVMRHPDRFAACMTVGNDVWRPTDAMNQPYTKAEMQRMHAAPVPLLQIAGTCEPLWYVPLNTWQPHTWNFDHVPSDWPKACPDDFAHPGRDPESDPMLIPVALTKPGSMRRPVAPRPPEGMDVSTWALDRVDTRLWLQGCGALNRDLCLEYLHAPDSRLHQVLGIPGEREESVLLDGIPHHTATYLNKAGQIAWQFTAVENLWHWPPVSTGTLGWRFFREVTASISSIIKEE